MIILIINALMNRPRVSGDYSTAVSQQWRILDYQGKKA